MDGEYLQASLDILSTNRVSNDNVSILEIPM